jgi:hypothetical protein
MNDIGLAEIALTLPLYFDPYTANRASGSFILIDPHTNATLAAGMIRRSLTTKSQSQYRKGAVLAASNSAISPALLEAGLRAAGAAVVRTRIADPSILRSLLALGLVVLFEGPGAPLEIDDAVIDLSGYSDADEVLSFLRSNGILSTSAGEHHAQ